MIESFKLAGPKPKETKVETFKIDYLTRTPKVEKFSLQPISKTLKGMLSRIPPARNCTVFLAEYHTPKIKPKLNTTLVAEFISPQKCTLSVL